MDAKQFLDEFGRDAATRVAESAGSNYAYFSQLAYGHRRPSVDLAERLIEASEGKLTFEGLLRGKQTSTDSQCASCKGEAA